MRLGLDTSEWSEGAWGNEAELVLLTESASSGVRLVSAALSGQQLGAVPQSVGSV